LDIQGKTRDGGHGEIVFHSTVNEQDLNIRLFLAPLLRKYQLLKKGEIKMIKPLIFISLMLTCGLAQADPGAFFGITYDIGSSLSGVGVSIKALSTNEEDKAAVDLGISYFPLANEDKFGVDLGVGYLFQNGAVTLGWDFLNSKPQLGVGYVNTQEDEEAVSTPTTEVSDQRLKRDIVYLKTLKNGIKLYSFKYSWSNEIYVGVMAQDLLLMSSYKDAVVLMEGNYYTVDYRALGLKMITLNEWRQSHENIYCSL